MIKDQIIDSIQEAASNVLYSNDLIRKFKEKDISVIDKVNRNDIQLDLPDSDEFGDYTTNFSMRAFRNFAKSVNSHVGEINWVGGRSGWADPLALASEIVEELKKNVNLSKIVSDIKPVGPGFINFWIKKDVLINNLAQIEEEKEKYGESDEGKGKRVVIDYSSPNIAKPFGIGHLRSTIIGAALYNLYKTLGYEVIGDNHLGDWGTQFGKLIYMIVEAKPSTLSIETLEKLYVEFHKKAEADPSLDEKAREWFKKLEEGDSEAKKIWQECVDVSMKEFNRVYEMLGVKIDFSFGESYYESEMKRMVSDANVKKHLSKGEEGAEVIDLSKEGIKTPLMFLKKDGATTYATRDLATIEFRERKWDPSIIIYEVGAEQKLHFSQIFAAAKLLGLVKDNVELVHTSHGLYLAPDGKKFSTRKGKTIKLEDVLDEAVERAEKLGDGNKDVARQVGIGAIKYFDLMHSVQSNVVFDWEKMMNLEGNSGPYLQYTVARCNSVLEKAENPFKIEYKDLNDRELSILRLLVHFSEIIETSAKLFSPNLLCNYLYDLASKYNNFYNSDRIIGSVNERFRLSLTSATRQVLKNGLKILGIETPEKM